MRKFFLTMVTIALFAVGFAASDEEESSRNEGSATQTEQKQETEAERQAREQKEEAEREAREQKEKEEQQENKKKEVAEYGYKRGYEYGFEGQSDVIGSPKTIIFTNKYGAPTNSEEKELFIIFRENFDKGYTEGNKMRYGN